MVKQQIQHQNYIKSQFTHRPLFQSDFPNICCTVISVLVSGCSFSSCKKYSSSSKFLWIFSSNLCTYRSNGLSKSVIINCSNQQVKSLTLLHWMHYEVDLCTSCNSTLVPCRDFKLCSARMDLVMKTESPHMFVQRTSRQVPHSWMWEFGHHQWWPWRTSSEHPSWHCSASSDPSSLSWLAILCWSPWWTQLAHLQLLQHLWWALSWSRNVHWWWSECPQTWCMKPCNNQIISRC